MAVDVMRKMLLSLLLVPGIGWADVLPDPTNPGLGEPSATTTAEASPAAASTNGLQTIIRRRGQRPAALINGELVKLGAKSGDSTLVKVGDDYVVLKGHAGKQVLRLTPDIKKTVRHRSKASPAKTVKAKQ